MSEDKLIRKWRPRMNRFAVTHLIWRMLASVPCNLKMSHLRHRYPDTNHSTIISFEPDVRWTTEEVFETLASRLADCGWLRARYEEHSMIWAGDLNSNAPRRCCALIMAGEAVTPFFYVRTPASLMAMHPYERT